MNLVQDFFFNLGLSLTRMFLLLHCLLILPISPPAPLSYSSGKSYSARKEADKDKFVSLAGFRSHVYVAETAISLPTIIGVSGIL